MTGYPFVGRIYVNSTLYRVSGTSSLTFGSAISTGVRGTAAMSFGASADPKVTRAASGTAGAAFTARLQSGLVGTANVTFGGSASATITRNASGTAVVNFTASATVKVATGAFSNAFSDAFDK